MFETDEFREKLEGVMIREARRRGLSQYQPAAVIFLQSLARENEAILLEAEERKAVVWRRRGVSDALESARRLARSAADLAGTEGRDTLTWHDVKSALETQYCQFWPFCR